MPLPDAILRHIPARWAARWPQIRAALLLYHVVGVVLLSIPSPEGAMQRSSWDDPTVQHEFEAWSRRLRAIGVHHDRRSLDQSLWSLSNRYLTVRRVITSPYDAYGTFAGSRQSWRMFTAPQRFPVRLEVSIRERGAYHTVYLSRSNEHVWRRDLFDHYRLRRAVFMMGWDRERRHFTTFADWVASRAAADYPDATDVLVRTVRYRTPEPSEALAGKEMLDVKYAAREERRLKR